MRKALFVVMMGSLVFFGDKLVFKAFAEYDWTPLERAISAVVNNQVLLNRLLNGNDNEIQLLQALQYYELELADIRRWRDAGIIGQTKLLNAGVITRAEYDAWIKREDAGWEEELIRLCDEFLQLVEDLKINKSIRKQLGL